MYYMRIDEVIDRTGFTNADRIRAMSDEELAKEFDAMASYCAPGTRPSPDNCLGCVNCWINWLKRPVEGVHD